MRAIRGYRLLAIVVALVTGGYASSGWAASAATDGTDKAQPTPSASQAPASGDESHTEPSSEQRAKEHVDISGRWYASPNGRFVLVDIDREASAKIEGLPKNQISDASGFVYVLDRETTTAVELPSYDRGADFLWSPDGTRLVYNDYAGSSETYCYIYKFAVKFGKLTARRTDLQKRLGSVSDVAPLFTSVHQYVEGKEWVDAHTLILDIRGYPTDDNKWYDWQYSFTVDGHFKKLKHDEGRCGGDDK